MTEPTPQRMLSGIESFDAIVGDSTRTPHGTGLLPNTAVVFSTQHCPGAFWRLGLAFARTAPRTILYTSSHYSMARLVEAGAVPQITLGGDPAPVLFAEFAPGESSARRASFTTWDTAYEPLSRTPSGVVVIDMPCEDAAPQGALMTDLRARNFAVVLVHYRGDRRVFSARTQHTHYADATVAHDVANDGRHALCLLKHQHASAPVNLAVHPGVFPSMA